MSQSTVTVRRLPWSIIIAGCLVGLMTFGPRSAMGFFQLPMLGDRGWDRTVFGLAMALQNLSWGLGQPVFGAIADKFGTWRVLLVSALFYASGLALMAVAPSPGLFYLGGGVLIGLGIAAGSYGIVLAAFARNVEADKRAFVFGLATAAGSAGMFIFAPVSQGFIEAFGWSNTLLIFGVAMLAVPFIAIPLRGNAASGIAEAAFEQTIRAALKEAMGHRSFVLLTAGFFVCGFQLAFITAHFPAYIADVGIKPEFAVLALSLIGFFNIIGSLGSGYISQRASKPAFLTFIYIARAVVIVIFLLAPKSGTSVVIFSIVMGLLWLSTVPPTNALVAVMFGTRHLGMLGGIVFLSHQVGSFLGVWLGGFVYDHFGSYNPVWWLGVGLAIFAAVVHWPIEERAVERPALMPAE